MNVLIWDKQRADIVLKNDEGPKDIMCAFVRAIYECSPGQTSHDQLTDDVIERLIKLNQGSLVVYMDERTEGRRCCANIKRGTGANQFTLTVSSDPRDDSEGRDDKMERVLQKVACDHAVSTTYSEGEIARRCKV